MKTLSENQKSNTFNGKKTSNEVSPENKSWFDPKISNVANSVSINMDKLSINTASGAMRRTNIENPAETAHGINVMLNSNMTINDITNLNDIVNQTNYQPTVSYLSLNLLKDLSERELKMRLSQTAIDMNKVKKLEKIVVLSIGNSGAGKSTTLYFLTISEYKKIFETLIGNIETTNFPTEIELTREENNEYIRLLLNIKSKEVILETIKKLTTDVQEEIAISFIRLLKDKNISVEDLKSDLLKIDSISVKDFANEALDGMTESIKTTFLHDKDKKFNIMSFMKADTEKLSKQIMTLILSQYISEIDYEKLNNTAIFISYIIEAIEKYEMNNAIAFTDNNLDEILDYVYDGMITALVSFIEKSKTEIGTTGALTIYVYKSGALVELGDSTDDIKSIFDDNLDNMSIELKLDTSEIDDKKEKRNIIYKVAGIFKDIYARTPAFNEKDDKVIINALVDNAKVVTPLNKNIQKRLPEEDKRNIVIIDTIGLGHGESASPSEMKKYIDMSVQKYSPDVILFNSDISKLTSTSKDIFRYMKDGRLFPKTIFLSNYIDNEVQLVLNSALLQDTAFNTKYYPLSNEGLEEEIEDERNELIEELVANYNYKETVVPPTLEEVYLLINEEIIYNEVVKKVEASYNEQRIGTVKTTNINILNPKLIEGEDFLPNIKDLLLADAGSLNTILCNKNPKPSGALNNYNNNFMNIEDSMTILISSIYQIDSFFNKENPLKDGDDIQLIISDDFSDMINDVCLEFALANKTFYEYDNSYLRWHTIEAGIRAFINGESGFYGTSHHISPTWDWLSIFNDLVEEKKPYQFDFSLINKELYEKDEIKQLEIIFKTKYAEALNKSLLNFLAINYIKLYKNEFERILQIRHNQYGLPMTTHRKRALKEHFKLCTLEGNEASKNLIEGAKGAMILAFANTFRDVKN